MRERLRLFRYTPYDALPALCGMANLALLIVLALYFEELPLWVIIPAFVLVSFCYSWNLNAISHNFIHNPFFASRWLNRAWGVMNSMAIGVPQTLFHHYHLTHHWGDNDRKGPDGKTKDLTSTYLHSKTNESEGFWRYSLLSFFRFDFAACYRLIKPYGTPRLLLVAMEALGVITFWILLSQIDWRFLVYFYIPSYYAGWTWSFAQNYSLHYGAQPGNYYANAVCSYNRVYNWLFFNNGYHQEHHWAPKSHWSKAAQVREEIRAGMIANNTRVIKGPHMTIYIEEWLERRFGQRGGLVKQKT